MFLTDSEQKITNVELDMRVRAIAGTLQAVAERGSRVVLLLPPGLDYVSAFLGCLYAGMMAVPAYPPQTARGMARVHGIAHSAAPSVVLLPEQLIPAAQANAGPRLAAARWIGVDTVEQPAAEQWRDPQTGPDDVAFLRYTSGSTREPHGVVLTHGNLLHNLAVIAERFQTSETSLVCSWLPPYHDMGLIGGILQPLYRGFPTVLMAAPERFVREPVSWLRGRSTYRADISGGPNFAFDRCVQRCPQRTWRTWTCPAGGSRSTVPRRSGPRPWTHSRARSPAAVSAAGAGTRATASPRRRCWLPVTATARGICRCAGAMAMLTRYFASNARRAR